MVQALPAYNEQMEKLSLHVEVCFLFTIVNYLCIRSKHVEEEGFKNWVRLACA